MDLLDNIDCLSSVNQVHSTKIFGGDSKNMFSVLIPTHKRASYLKETLDSVLNQVDFDDYSIIVVDNNPERGDETEILMLDYNKDKRVSYYKNDENVGMAGNWNKCLLLSPSDNVILIHDDDIMSPYCLSVFSKTLPFLSEDWSILKPQLYRFTETHNLHFNNYTKADVIKLSHVNFYSGCAVGAPSIVLLNRSKILLAGGYNQEFFPSFDYVMSAKQIIENSVYKLDCFLGGYRISCNESLSEKTMDLYFKKKCDISSALMMHCGWSSFIAKLFNSLCIKDSLFRTCNYYNMHGYSLKKEELDLYEINNIFCKIFMRFFRKYSDSKSYKKTLFFFHEK